jgi:hypothetical protein
MFPVVNLDYVTLQNCFGMYQSCFLGTKVVLSGTKIDSSCANVVKLSTTIVKLLTNVFSTAFDKLSLLISYLPIVLLSCFTAFMKLPHRSGKVVWNIEIFVLLCSKVPYVVKLSTIVM